MFVSVVTRRMFGDSRKRDSKHLAFASINGAPNDFELVIARHAEQCGKEEHVAGNARSTARQVFVVIPRMFRVTCWSHGTVCSPLHISLIQQSPRATFQQVSVPRLRNWTF